MVYAACSCKRLHFEYPYEVSFHTSGRTKNTVFPRMLSVIQRPLVLLQKSIDHLLHCEVGNKLILC